jgi:hypothetical protein
MLFSAHLVFSFFLFCLTLNFWELALCEQKRNFAYTLNFGRRARIASSCFGGIFLPLMNLMRLNQICIDSEIVIRCYVIDKSDVLLCVNSKMASFLARFSLFGGWISAVIFPNATCRVGKYNVSCWQSRHVKFENTACFPLFFDVQKSDTLQENRRLPLLFDMNDVRQYANPCMEGTINPNRSLGLLLLWFRFNDRFGIKFRELTKAHDGL